MRRGSRRSGKKMNAVVSRGEVQTCLDMIQRICNERNCGPGTVEYSLKCRLVALNGNWPRIKKETWISVSKAYARMISGLPLLPDYEKNPGKCCVCGVQSGDRARIDSRSSACHACMRRVVGNEMGQCELCLSFGKRFDIGKGRLVCEECKNHFFL